MADPITPPPELLKKFSIEARDESNKRNGTGYLKTFAKLCIEWALNSKSSPNNLQIRSSGITPPPELVQQWCNDDPNYSIASIATRAAQWGADQELAATLGLMETLNIRGVDYIRNVRRPKPPSLKEQAFAELEKVDMLWDTTEFGQETLGSLDTIRRALEALPDD